VKRLENMRDNLEMREKIRKLPMDREEPGNSKIIS